MKLLVPFIMWFLKMAGNKLAKKLRSEVKKKNAKDKKKVKDNVISMDEYKKRAKRRWINAWERYKLANNMRIVKLDDNPYE